MTRTLLTIVAFVAISAAVPAQTAEPPISDARLTVHSLLREDVFAGFLQGDVTRMARAEKNAELLRGHGERSQTVGSIPATLSTRSGAVCRSDEAGSQ